MKNFNKIMNAIGIMNIFLIAASAFGCIYALTIANAIAYKIICVSELVMLVFSVFYLFEGFKKGAAKYYSTFMTLYAIIHLVEIAGYQFDPELSINMFMSPLEAIVSMVLYGNTMILAVGKDLGKTLSLSLCGINFAAYTLCFIAAITGFIDFDVLLVNKTAAIAVYFTWFAISLIALLMTVAKYVDKTNRGTK